MNSGLGQAGQAMVEFVLVAPILFLVLLGIVDFGRAIAYNNEVTNAAREGARVAILASNPCNTIIANSQGNCSTTSGTGVTVCQAIQNEAPLVGAPGASQWASCSDGNQNPVPPCTSNCTSYSNKAYVATDSSASCTTPGSLSTPRRAGHNAIKVTVVYYFRPLTALLTPFFNNGFFLSSSTCARQEW